MHANEYGGSPSGAVMHSRPSLRGVLSNDAGAALTAVMTPSANGRRSSATVTFTSTGYPQGLGSMRPTGVPPAPPPSYSRHLGMPVEEAVKPGFESPTKRGSHMEQAPPGRHGESPPDSEQHEFLPGQRVQAHGMDQGVLNGAKGSIVGVTGKKINVFFTHHGLKSLSPQHLRLAEQYPGAACVRIVAPGAGTRTNKAVYDSVQKDSSWEMEIWGKAGDHYDRYPESWPGGEGPPNLESFAQKLLEQGLLRNCDCLIFGSRGGQVVLPYLWQQFGTAVPPAIVINGGCAGNLPQTVFWPVEAVAILLIGGEDEFRGTLTLDEYLKDTKAKVPPANATTAVVFVHEMLHMPQSHLLRALLPYFIRAALGWQDCARPPMHEFEAILASLMKGGFNGTLSYTRQKGGWEDITFSAASMDEPISPMYAKRSLRRGKTMPLPSEAAYS
mmetsp:Transcript_57375/g.105979  ORF Transcript_57375/g.105979 Transcript_57375/m.105979 type:complete len:443 (+) Transcript_57375:54-1382(+)